MKIAIIDMGTNTFNLLIAKTHPKQLFFPEVRTKRAVKLGFGMNASLEFEEFTINRALEALSDFHSIIESHQCDLVKIIATSAMRTAVNSSKIVTEAKRRFNFTIEIIEGEKEAYFIYKGAIASQLDKEKVLILDIGGGSTEFIIADQSTIYWKKSFELGVAKIIKLLQPSDPISSNNIMAFHQILDQTLPELIKELKLHSPKKLLGCSGSFDSFYDILHPNLTITAHPQMHQLPIDVEEYNHLHQLLIHSTHTERMELPGLIELRVDMIVLASILTKYVLNNSTIESIFACPFSLKEGVLFDTINKISS